jgi:hypothetical protein
VQQINRSSASLSVNNNNDLSFIALGRRQRGSVLIYLIVLMVIFSIFGAGMVSMFGSSVLSIFATNSARRAQYLAESGLRYTISEVRNASAATRETALNTIDDASVGGKWFGVFPGVARYQVRVYHYWSKTVGSGAATTVVTATVANSGFPPGYAIPGVPGVARLQVGTNNPVGINSVTGATAGSKAVTYTLASAVTIANGVAANANLAFPTINAGQTITKGSTATPLVLNINAVTAIPQRNGEFTDAASGGLYTYQIARVVGANVQLENINWTAASATVTFPANSYLIFSQAARLDATGEHVQTQKVMTDYLALSSTTSPMSPPQNQQPPSLTAAGSGFSNDMSALDLTGSGNRVALQGYIATGGAHSYWLAFQRLGEAGYRFADPEQSSCNIGYHVAPISTAISDDLRNVWLQYHQLSYDVQVKMGWDLNLNYAAQGVAFRWHENQNFPGKYEGYALSFMRFDSKTSCSGDMIPNTIKPGSGNNMRNKLLLVLWEQKVNASGVETKDWLAYAELGNPTNYQNPAAQRSPADQDQKVTGNQGWPDGRLNDNAGIVVRVEDKFVGSVRYSDIKLFYSDGSPYTFQNDSRTKDRVATNKERARYYPQWLETGSPPYTIINPTWPSNTFGLNGNSIAYWYNDLTTGDYFTLTSSAPTAPYNTVTLTTNPSPNTGFSPVTLLPDNGTIRTADFVLDAYPSGRKEIGLFAMGNLSGGITVAFDDFYIQMLGGY